VCSQDDVSQQQRVAPLSLPQLTRLFEASFVRDESSASNADVVLKLMFPDSRHSEQLSPNSQQHIVSTIEDFVLRTEMTGLESQEEDTPKLIIFFKTMSCLGQIRSHRRDEVWSLSL
jgi:hypothetical protein